MLVQAAENNIDPSCVERYLLLDPFSRKFQLFSEFEIRMGTIGSEYLSALIIPSVILMDLACCSDFISNWGVGYLALKDDNDFIFKDDHLPDRFLDERVKLWLDDWMMSEGTRAKLTGHFSESPELAANDLLDEEKLKDLIRVIRSEFVVANFVISALKDGLSFEDFIRNSQPKEGYVHDLNCVVS